MIGQARVATGRRCGRAARLRTLVPIYLMVLPTVVLFGVFVAFPLAAVVGAAMLDWNGIVPVRDARWVALANFATLVRDPVWWLTVRNSLCFTGVMLLVETPLALGLALLLNAPGRAMGFFRTVAFLPAVTGAAVIGLAANFFFSPIGGPANAILVDRLGVLDAPVAFLGDRALALWTVCAVAVWHSVGFDVVILLAALQAVDPEVMAAALVDGANPWQRLRDVTLPAIWPVLAACALLTTVNSLKAFDYFAVMTGGGPGFSSTPMVMYMLRFATFGGGMGPATVPAVGYGSAVAVAIGVIAMAALLLEWGAARRFPSPD